MSFIPSSSSKSQYPYYPSSSGKTKGTILLPGTNTLVGAQAFPTNSFKTANSFGFSNAGTINGAPDLTAILSQIITILTSLLGPSSSSLLPNGNNKQVALDKSGGSDKPIVRNVPFNRRFESDIVGPDGDDDDGNSGSTGDSGDAGSTGHKGHTHRHGSSGSTGDSGDTGSTGHKGHTHRHGNSGSSSDSGDAGSTGHKGHTHRRGNSGSSGNSGDTGSTGSSGDADSTGNAGSSGSVPSKTGNNDMDRWDAQIEAAAKSTGLPANYIKATIWAESRGNPDDPSKNPEMDAIDEGVMQISDETYSDVTSSQPNAPKGLKAGNPDDNIMMGAWELKDKLDKHGGDFKATSNAYVGEGINPEYADNVMMYWKELDNGETLTDN